MTTDITKLAQREKFEAWWERTQHNGNPPRFGWSRWRDGEGYKVDDDDSELDGMWEAWKAASAEMVEALEKAQAAERRWHRVASRIHEQACESDVKIDELEAIRAAAEKLVRCKGRYHSGLNYRALAALFGVNTPDLPPLEHENVHYADAAEMEIAALRQRIAELEREVIRLQSLKTVNAALQEAQSEFHRGYSCGHKDALLESRTLNLPRPGFVTISGERTAVYLKADVDAVLAAAGIKREAE